MIVNKEFIKNTILNLQKFDDWRFNKTYSIGIDLLENDNFDVVDKNLIYLLSHYILSNNIYLDDLDNKVLLEVIKDDIEWWLYEEVDKNIHLTMYDLDYDEIPLNSEIIYDVTDINDFVTYLESRYSDMPCWFYDEFYVENNEEDED